MDPRVAVIVVSWNARDDLVACLRSLRAVTAPLEVVVVDNASEDGSAAAARQSFPDARVIEPGANLGFARACNLGWRATRAPYVLFLNPDAEVAPAAVEALAAVLDARPDVGIVGPATRYADGRPQVSFGPDLTPLGEWRQQRLMRAVRARDARTLSSLEAAISREHEPAWVSASCLMTRRSLLENLGGFDERFFLYEEDVDLCVRARHAGFRVAFTPSASVTHRLGRSMERSSERARIEYDRSHLYFYRKHRGPWATALLRVYLGVTGLAGLVRAGTDDDRKVARARLGLAVARTAEESTVDS
jgi:N-acetylglucosaminyl-diphospho-decaprenol L-rhamnosyltransferase